ncbi:MAG: cytochrome P450 [Nannocystaceae bacterium]
MSLRSRALHDDAHAHFRRMRRESPVYRARLSLRRDVYLVTRYDDVKALLAGDDLVKKPGNAEGARRRREPWAPAMIRPLLTSLLFADDPAHRRIRGLVRQAFTPRRIALLEPRIAAITEALLDRVVARRGRDAGRLELVDALALPLPLRVIAELVGVPDEDLPRFLAWSQRILGPTTPLHMLRALPAVRGFLRYVDALADARRASPRGDLMSALVAAEDAGDRLSRDELLGMVFLLLTAGHETTVSLITNGVRALLESPDQLALLRAQPELMDLAIEELLRFDGPLLTTELYYARRPLMLRGATIPAGEAVLPVLLSANRDEAAFADADRLDIRRDPNPHLAFGRGAHFCLGAPLARLEGRVAIAALLRRLPGLRLAEPAQPQRYENAWILHKPRGLALRWG